MAEFFGFEIKRKSAAIEKPAVSFVPKTDEDGAGVDGDVMMIMGAPIWHLPCMACQSCASLKTNLLLMTMWR